MKKQGVDPKWYHEQRVRPGVLKGTEKGKKAALAFVKALDERMKAEDSEGTKAYFNEWGFRLAHTQEIFYKYLAQMPEFDQINDPAYPVPIITIWLRRDGEVQMIHNFWVDDFKEMCLKMTGRIMSDIGNRMLAEKHEKMERENKLVEAARKESESGSTKN